MFSKKQIVTVSLDGQELTATVYAVNPEGHDLILIPHQLPEWFQGIKRKQGIFLGSKAHWRIHLWRDLDGQWHDHYGDFMLLYTVTPQPTKIPCT